MVRVAIAATLIAVAPLGAQATDTATAADTTAVRAAALREIPQRRRATARVTQLALRGDTADVTVVFADVEYAPGKRAIWDLRLTLARRDSGWVALPTRTMSVGHYARPR